jgi:hypothetical protein
MALLQEAADADVERDFIEERIAAVARPLPSTDASGPPPTNQEGSLDCEPDQAARRNPVD